jgi:Protein-kinase domain of FAM69
VTLKKLGRNRDIEAWERRICSSAGQQEGCDVSKAATKAFTASGTKWMVSHLKGMSNMTACPTERLLEKLMDRYREKLDAIDLSARERIQLVTTIMLSQEPILLQAFPRSEGWPFVGYVGACGRFVAIEAGWTPLYEFLDESWLVRARLALQVLAIANKLTDNKSQYGIYWTDVGFADFGVDDATGNVVVVNGRNLMVVDRYQIKEDKKTGWDEPLYSRFDDCHDR